ncbi:aldo/keto reductase [Acetobacteraceae bacterium KSS8]|uniref:Aldo/keto reductase n=1 Tax=Endosaccharibacter trunci TaxID=2812733 RepID=A0ABT1W7B2_9PROT|nr:aldo/keto reductase [Acetobacteraceae bacterium KSS8]
MREPQVRLVRLADGVQVPCLGQGTWHMGEDPTRRDSEIDSLRTGIALGMTLIDTAEMYGDGASETLVGEAIQGLREQVTLVTKVLPSHAGRREVAAACEASLRRLGVQRIDVLLLHWRGSTPLAETVEAFEKLRAEGLIGAWGVSNFDVDDLEELAEIAPLGHCVTNQVLFNLGYRGIEFDLLPACAHAGMPIMAYSPVGQGGAMLRTPALVAVSARHGCTPAQAALAWTLRIPGVLAIPKAGSVAHVRENAEAAAIALTEEDLDELDRAFPPPRSKRPLAML